MPAFLPSLPLPTTPRPSRPPSLSPHRPQMVLQTRRTQTPDALQSTLQALHASPIVLCIRQKSAQTALQSALAALRGGLHAIEVALTTPDALSIIRQLSTHPNALIGAGTVLTPDQARCAADAGARFALSPVYSQAVVQTCHELDMLAVPGAATPTEIHTAFEGGAKLVKIFPINLYGGLQFVQAMKGPLGHIPLLPTSGVDLSNLGGYLGMDNVLAVGAARQILSREAVEQGRWEQVEERARQWIQIAKQYR